MSKYPIKIINDAVNFYINNEKETAKTVAEKFNISSSSLAYHLLKRGVARQKGAKTKIENVNYFDIINTEEKAYFLGWIMADGNVSIHNQQYSLKLQVTIKDKDVIDYFLKVIKSSNKTLIKKSKKDKIGNRIINVNEAYYVSLTSRHMIESLIKHGITPNKTGKETIPNSVPDHLKRHFIRGFFDGDGCASFFQSGKRTGTRYHFGFVGPRDMLIDIQSHVGESTGIYDKVGVCQFGYGKKQGLILYKYMYENCNIWFERKRNIFEEVYGDTEVIIRNKNLMTP